MKTWLAFILVGCFATAALAEETAADKAQAATNTAKRKSRKAANRVKEALCAEGDVKCAARKVGHRIEEGTQTVP